MTGIDRLATWGPLPNESGKAYEGFKTYRDLGLKRSVRKAAATLDKSASLCGRWSKRHSWPARAAAWDAEQADLMKDAHLQAVTAMNDRHGQLARGLLSRVAAELGAHIKGVCPACKRTPIKLTPAQVANALRAGVEVERLSLGQSTAGSPVVNQTTVNNNYSSSATALVLLRDPEAQVLAGKLLSRMKTLDPATSLRRLAGEKAAAALASGEAHADARPIARREVAEADREVAAELAADPSGQDREPEAEVGAFEDNEDLF